MSAHALTDTQFLWWLGNPRSPVPIGELHLLRELQGVSLRYFDTWLATGFALSEDLPLTGVEYRPTERDSAAGAVDDAKPDRWGERVIRFIEKPPRLSVLEYLYFAGDERFGALGVSLSPTQYLPHRTGPLPRLADVKEMQDLVQDILNNVPVPEEKRRLIAPGTTLGGARPKALINLGGMPWVVKFCEEDDAVDTPLIEHACMTLAGRARIRVASTRAIRVSKKRHAVAIRRFDREGTGNGIRRVHAQTARVVLRAEGSVMGYPELAQLLRRRGQMEGRVARDQMRELFRRMALNILMDNTDDHEKNHAILVDDQGRFHLSPAFDVLPTAQSLGYQQMRVGRDAADSTIENALSEAALFGLPGKEAVAEAAEVARVCAGWKDHFREAGVARIEIEYLAQHIDRPFLRAQREDLVKAAIRKA